jgi:hypothetical protein
MVNPFSEIDWKPDRAAVKSFGKTVLLVSVIVAPVAFGIHTFLSHEGAKEFFGFLSKLFSVFFGLGLISFLLPPLGSIIYKVWYFLAACAGLIVTNVLLLLFFFGFITPIALFMRFIVRRDPLVLKPPSSTSMWIDHDPAASVSRYYRQY